MCMQIDGWLCPCYQLTMHLSYTPPLSSYPQYHGSWGDFILYIILCLGEILNFLKMIYFGEKEWMHEMDLVF